MKTGAETEVRTCIFIQKQEAERQVGMAQTTPPNNSQTVVPTGDQVVKHESIGDLLIRTIIVPKPLSCFMTLISVTKVIQLP